MDVADNGHVEEPAMPTEQEQVDATARRVLLILGVVALVAVVVALVLFALRTWA